MLPIRSGVENRRKLEVGAPANPAVPAPRPADPTERHRDRFVLPPPKLAPVRPLSEMLPKNVGDKRTAADAIAEANDLLLGGKRDDHENGAEVLRDAPDVGSSADTTETDARHEAAEAQLDANAKLEAAHLATLSDEDRAHYQAVKQRCLDAKDPVAALALQKMLFQGDLPGPKDMKGEGTTLDHLAALADEKTPLAEGIDRNQLVTDVVQELATPSAINQGPRGTCAPTTLAIQLAIDEPAEYARIVAGLASPSGEVVLAGGTTLVREDGTASDDGSGRSVSQRLMGSAFMEVANGANDYQNATGDGAGANSDSLDILYEQVMGRPMEALWTNDADKQAEGIELIDRQLRAGASVPISLKWPPGYHEVLITGTTSVDGEQYYTYINPWGREERIKKSELEGRLSGVNYDPVRDQIGGVLQRIDHELHRLDPVLDGIDGVKDFLNDIIRDARRAIIPG